MFVCIHIYTYMHMYREREGEKERDRDRDRDMAPTAWSKGWRLKVGVVFGNPQRMLKFGHLPSTHANNVCKALEIDAGEGGDQETLMIVGRRGADLLFVG